MDIVFPAGVVAHESTPKVESEYVPRDKGVSLGAVLFSHWLAPSAQLAKLTVEPSLFNLVLAAHRE